MRLLEVALPEHSYPVIEAGSSTWYLLTQDDGCVELQQPVSDIAPVVGTEDLACKTAIRGIV